MTAAAAASSFALRFSSRAARAGSASRYRQLLASVTIGRSVSDCRPRRTPDASCRHPNHNHRQPIVLPCKDPRHAARRSTASASFATVIGQRETDAAPTSTARTRPCMEAARQFHIRETSAAGFGRRRRGGRQATAAAAESPQRPSSCSIRAPRPADGRRQAAGEKARRQQRRRASARMESPTAWASFATGVNAGKHNIYDFLIRDTSTACRTSSRCTASRRASSSTTILIPPDSRRHVVDRSARPASDRASCSSRPCR